MMPAAVRLSSPSLDDSLVSFLFFAVRLGEKKIFFLLSFSFHLHIPMQQPERPLPQGLISEMPGGYVLLKRIYVHINAWPIKNTQLAAFRRGLRSLREWAHYFTADRFWWTTFYPQLPSSTRKTTVTNLILLLVYVMSA
jgi:hypothetical protein